MEKEKHLVVAFSTNDKEHIANAHFGDGKIFLVYKLTKNEAIFIRQHINDAPEEKSHADERKKNYVLSLLKDVDVIASALLSPNFIKMSQNSIKQPLVIGKDLTIKEAIKKLQNKFDTLYDLVEKRKAGFRSNKVAKLKDL